ncbi:hypothetical protein M3Y96_00757300 [Aphelenchoides besseyi]|nr:hypothetical protein M3Y96_00757300 [Aphelenchoides besseyi]
MPDTNNTGNGNGNMNAQTSRLRMRDYLKITEMLDGKPKSRARRYNYDLSEVMNADDDSRIDKQELGLEQDLGLRQVKASKPKLSLIGAVNPMQLPGSPFIPAPKRKIPSTPKEGVGRVSCPSTNDSV